MKDENEEVPRKRNRVKNAAVNAMTGKCLRCAEWFGRGGTCANCGVGRDRIVRPANKMRRNKIGGKRGRNSGKVSQHGKK